MVWLQRAAVCSQEGIVPADGITLQLVSITTTLVRSYPLTFIRPYNARWSGLLGVNSNLWRNSHFGALLLTSRADMVKR